MFTSECAFEKEAQNLNAHNIHSVHCLKGYSCIYVFMHNLLINISYNVFAWSLMMMMMMMMMKTMTMMFSSHLQL